MTKCIVKNCRSSPGTDSGITLHSFPKSINLIKLWLQQTGNSLTDIDSFARNVLYSRSGRYQICSKHFSPDCYVFNGAKRVLRQDAVPTVSQAQSVSKAPTCQKVGDEIKSHLHSSPSRACAESPPQRHQPRDQQPEDQEHAAIIDRKHSSTITVTTTDKSVGTDPYSDLIEEKIEKLLNRRLLNLAMEIISMLTGEEYLMVKKNSNSPNATSKREVPVKCGDVSVYFSMEEWDYIEDHKDFYQDAMVEGKRRPKSCRPPAEPECHTQQVQDDVEVGEMWDDGQSQEAGTQLGVITDTCADGSEGEFSNVSNNGAKEDPCVESSLKTSADEEETGTAEECQNSEFGEEPYIMTCSPGDIVEDGQTIFPDSQAGDEGEQFPGESPKQEMENLSYSASGQCEEQAWSDYEQYATEPGYTSDDPSYASGEPSYASGEPSYASGEPSYASGEPSYASGEPSYASGEPSYASGEPSYASGEPSYASDNPSYASGGPSYASDEPLQIKEESGQSNYHEEPSFIDPTPIPACEERSQLFDTMNNLLIHQITFGQSSSVDKPYPCSHCNKRFAKRSHLGMHLKTHSGERPYACPDCGKKFSRRSNMLTHYRTHTGEKPFACPKCGKRFTQSSHMVTHQKTHSGDKLFTCPECKKCFTKWSYLNFHLRTHGIEKLSVT